MTPARRRALRYALIAVGLIAIFGLYPITVVWPSGWRWDPDNGLYLQMIVSLYATLGVFLLIAARNPEEHLSLIWFTVWSSVAHGGVMAARAIVPPEPPARRRAGALRDRSPARRAHAAARRETGRRYAPDPVTERRDLTQRWAWNDALPWH